MRLLLNFEVKLGFAAAVRIGVDILSPREGRE